MNNGVSTYRSVSAQGGLADATPYQVIQLMLDAVIARISEARGHIERGEIEAKGEKIGKALGIIEALVLGLDKERGGEVAENLERLYDYASRTLLKANLESSVELLKEVGSLLREIKVGWDGIAPAAQSPQR